MSNKVEICGVNTNNLPKFTPEELSDLMSKIKQGDEQAKDKFIYGNMRLVLSVVQRFNNRKENPDDLFQVGCVGLIKAIDNFNIEDAVEEIDKKPVTKYGDIWHIGKHKLICADSTKLDEVEKLFVENEQASLIVTDPPYNIDYGNSEQDRARAMGREIENRSILNDNMDDESFYKFLRYLRVNKALL